MQDYEHFKVDSLNLVPKKRAMRFSKPDERQETSCYAGLVAFKVPGP
jgi:hypothetical protein